MSNGLASSRPRRRRVHLETAMGSRQAGQASSLSRRALGPRIVIIGLEAHQADKLSAPLVYQRRRDANGCKFASSVCWARNADFRTINDAHEEVAASASRLWQPGTFDPQDFAARDPGRNFDSVQ